jgi:hypothetical protein
MLLAEALSLPTTPCWSPVAGEYSEGYFSLFLEV